MPETPDSNSIFSTDLDNAEARMRRSLQMTGRPKAQEGHKPNPFGDRQSGTRPRQRFVQDGDVPVTIVSRLRPQEPGRTGSPAAEGALAAEQAARVRAERALAEANATIHEMQTKAGHAELARREAVNAHEAELMAELAAERSARQAAEAALQEAVQTRDQARQASLQLPATAEKPVSKTPRKQMVKTTALRRGREPKPVKWWLTTAKK